MLFSIHNHSQYSFLDGMVRPEHLVTQAAEYGWPAVALTDHGNIVGHVELYRAARERGLTPILGVEIYVFNPLYYRNRKTSSRPTWADTHLPPGTEEVWAYLAETYPRQALYHLLVLIPFDALPDARRLLFHTQQVFNRRPFLLPQQLHEVLPYVVVTTGCLATPMGQLVLAGAEELASRFLDYLEARARRLFPELQIHPELEDLNRYNAFLLHRYPPERHPWLWGDDAHYLNPAQAPFHRLVLRMNTRGGLDFSGDTYYLTPPEGVTERVRSAFPAGTASALLRALERGGRALLDELGPVPDDLYPSDYQIPQVPQGLEVPDLEDLAWRALKGQGKHRDPAYRQRLQEEIDVIRRLGMMPYFQILYFLIHHIVRKHTQVWTVRGSAGGSLFLHLLGISHLDPLRYGLLFERFINPDRVSMPDVDVDVPTRHREAILRDIETVFGAQRVTGILNITYARIRQLVQDALKALGVPHGRAVALSKKIPDAVATLDDLLQHQEWWDLAREILTPQVVRNLEEALPHLVGRLVRSFGQHAAGVLILPRPVYAYTAIMPTPEDARSVLPPAQVDMALAETVGLLKFDFLGVSGLDVLERTIQGLGMPYRELIDLGQQPGEHVRSLMVHMETAGIHQAQGSEGIARLLAAMQAEGLEDLTAAVALYRPGTIKVMGEYLRRRREALRNPQARFPAPHPTLDEVLQETYGLILYQEQVMQAVRRLAGFSPAEADYVRKAISKKRGMERWREEFIRRAPEASSLSPEEAARLWDEQFAAWGGYGFNKSHAAAYAHLAAMGCWLKHHHYDVFMAAYMTEFLEKDDKFRQAAHEVRRRGFRFLPPYLHQASPFEVRRTEGGFLLPFLALWGFQRGSARALAQVRDLVPPPPPSEGIHAVLDWLERATDLNATQRLLLLLSGALDPWCGDGSEPWEARWLALLDLMSRNHPVVERLPTLLGTRDLRGLSHPTLAPWFMAQGEFVALNGLYLTLHPLRMVQAQRLCRGFFGAGLSYHDPGDWIRAKEQHWTSAALLRDVRTGGQGAFWLTVQGATVFTDVRLRVRDIGYRHNPFLLPRDRVLETLRTLAGQRKYRPVFPLLLCLRLRERDGRYYVVEALFYDLARLQNVLEALDEPVPSRSPAPRAVQMRLFD